jgi:hypothetical protein
VDVEAIRRIMLGCLVAAAFGVVSIANAGPARDLALREEFARGTRLYENREYAAAVRSFAAVARDAPRAPDAWSNLGTAGYAASDTAAASVGWQRALRLEPRAADARERIALLGTTERGFVSLVPPVSSGEMATLALMLWISVWTLLALRAGGRPVPSGALLALAGAIVVTGTAAGGMREVERGVRLAVVGEGGMLRTLPALGGDRGAIVLTGEVARTRARQGVWTRVELDGGRVGWVETQRLVPLGG